MVTIECPICYDIVEDPVITHCAHFFCNECINSHLTRNNNCPVCREPIKKSELVATTVKKPTQVLEEKQEDVIKVRTAISIRIS